MARFEMQGEVLVHRGDGGLRGSKDLKEGEDPEAKSEYLRFEIIDFNCRALSKTVPLRHRSSSIFMYSGALAYGANSEVMTIPQEVASSGCPNSLLLPDWSSEQVLPWASRPELGIVVRRVYCEQASIGAKQGQGSASKECSVVPRAACRRLLEELQKFQGRGLEIFAGGELEFTLLQRDASSSWVPAFRGVNIFATLQNSKAMDFCYHLERQMAAPGVDIMTINAEYGEGQMEVTFAPKFGIEAADMTATFRTGTKEIAQREGFRATFMAKPFGVSGVGNGGHFNFSLWEQCEELKTPGAKSFTADQPDIFEKNTAGYRSAFHDSSDSAGLSGTARAFLAGILEHAPALEALCSPTPPCYCRHGNWAPDVANWGFDHRGAAVRVKSDAKGKPTSCYMELRMPSAAANPYLVMAGLIAAGLDGLERDLELPSEMEKSRAKKLPSSLAEALSALESDQYMVSKLGQDLVRWFLLVKQREMQVIQERVDRNRLSMREDDAVSEAWQHMYMEFV